MNVPVQLLASIESDSISHFLNGQLRLRPFGGVHCAGIPGHFESLSSLAGFDIHSFLPRAVPTSTTWSIWRYFWCSLEFLNYLSFRQIYHFVNVLFQHQHFEPHGIVFVSVPELFVNSVCRPLTPTTFLHPQWAHCDEGR